MLDSALVLTIFFIFGAAIIAAIIAARVRDPCLKQWRGYPVRVDLRSGERYAGRLRSETSGLEVVFPQAQPAPAGPPHHSFVLYREEYARIDRLIRVLDTLTPDERRRRDRALRHAYRPGPHRRWARRLRNWLNTLKDAVADAAAAVAGRAGFRAEAGRAGSTGAAMLGAVGRAYDPLLERYIGRRVVIVVVNDDGNREEYMGIFREYSSAFLAIVDVDFIENGAPQAADLILPRPRATLRASADSG